jgi:hypothetical protein
VHARVSGDLSESAGRGRPRVHSKGEQ